MLMALQKPHRYAIEIPALMDNADWEAEGLGRLEPPGKVQ